MTDTTKPWSVVFTYDETELLEEAEQIERARVLLDTESSRDLLGIVDLADVMEGGSTDPEMLVTDLLVKYAHTLIFGPKEQGKTWCAMCAAAQVMSEGGTVVWVDKEMGRSMLANRFEALGIPSQAVREQLLYMEYPTLDGSKDSRALWAIMLQYRNPHLIVIDAQTEVLADAGLNENVGTDIDRWMGWYLSPARRLGITTVILDHTGHDEATRSRGSGHKGNAAKVELAVTCTKKFSRSEVGTIKVERKKNTADAPIPECQWYRIGGGDLEEGFVFEQMTTPPPPADEHADTARRIRAEIEALLIQHAGQKLSTTLIKREVRGNATLKSEVLKSLPADSSSPVEAELKGQSILYGVPEGYEAPAIADATHWHGE